MKIIPNKKNCQAARCTNDRSGTDRFCHKHRKRFHKETNPIKYTYNVRKNNAKRRGKPFTLTFEEFEKFCIETGYMEKKGRTKNAMSMDRVENTEGYHADNIQPMSVGNNSKKRHTTDTFGTEDDLPF